MSAATAAVRLDGGTLSLRCPRFAEQMRCALRALVALAAACERLRRPLPARLDGGTLSLRCPQFAEQMRCALRAPARIDCGLRMSAATAAVRGSMGSRHRCAVRNLPGKCAVRCERLSYRVRLANVCAARWGHALVMLSAICRANALCIARACPYWLRLVNACGDRCLCGSMGSRSRHAVRDLARRLSH